MTDDLRVVPASEARWVDLQTVFGTRGTAPICQCQRFKLARREAFRAAGLTEVSHPTKRRLVMRIDFHDTAP